MLKLLAIALPVIIDLVNRKVTDNLARFWISAGICGIVGIGLNLIETNLFQGLTNLTQIFDGISESILYVFGLAQLSYKILWENSAVRNNLGLNSKLQNLDP